MADKYRRVRRVKELLYGKVSRRERRIAEGLAKTIVAEGSDLRVSEICRIARAAEAANVARQEHASKRRKNINDVMTRARVGVQS